ncbi:alpha/beta hydrolase [Salipiger mangrovisoli]|uniref:Alpha/beta fold hydrolase n=1 Tax=Salipiger mangrovisoli TaxID=2865933 RepID=A0ABR9X926_9RHOB|nr:alpha/beta fold hydrolase [Salipiger mangrovisoli]MBE9640063.1 alpha/beta fold hydrolase [Salipiger mangrovisoli]MCA0946779.1 alpha/beta fold hydrolase [Alloyangia pacifica]
MTLRTLLLSATASLGLAAQAFAFEPLTIIDQGSFSAGGTVTTEPGSFDHRSPMDTAGQSFHGDHAYAFYQVPEAPRSLPLVLWHGAFQSGKSWETTADGREGFQTLMLRRHFPVYTIDQPRRGRAGNSTAAAEVSPMAFDQLYFDMFRIGQWPEYFDGVQFDGSEETLGEFFRSVTPNTGAFDPEVVSDGVSALVDRIGPSILVTHSQAGGPGWLTAIKNPDVRAVISYEPGSGYVFPESEMPEPMSGAAGTLEPVAIPDADFQKLTQIPIIVYYGDNIPEEPTDLFGLDNWRTRLAMARLWVNAINARGGDATLVHLPEEGIIGNTHFIFSDLNNAQIADLAAEWIEAKGLGGLAQ